MQVNLVFPHQLFESSPLVKRGQLVFLVEEFLFFRQYAFHRQKLAFHRASMKHYQRFLEDQGCRVQYVDSGNESSDIRKLIPGLREEGFHEVHCVDPVDAWLERRLQKACGESGLKLIIHLSPMFLNSREDLGRFFRNDKKKFFQTEFYISERKRLGLLLDEKGNPEGGKWSFDAENRERYPAGKKPPLVEYPQADAIYSEAVDYVNREFPGNPGSLDARQLYPVNVEQSRQWLIQFLENRFREFGPYEDALVAGESILHHSVLTPMLNSGLITPSEVLSESIQYARDHNIPLNSLEGFVRQVTGWREFIRGVYQSKGWEQRTRNFWGFKRKIPASFYTGTTGIEPVDLTIRKVLATGYSHHIERLMVLGNFMLLCEFDPDEVYRWFMELFIDAYDWVMVPNVYGMSQFADGGLMATKPYISGSNYLMKMSDYKSGPWQKTWDALFWRFMHVHRDFFLKNPRLGMLVRTFDKMSPARQEELLLTATEFLVSLQD